MLHYIETITYNISVSENLLCCKIKLATGRKDTLMRKEFYYYYVSLILCVRDGSIMFMATAYLK